MIRPADRTQRFSESVIREMTRLALKYGAINLAQGMPDNDPPEPVLAAAEKALRDGQNQYSITWGVPELRQAIAARYEARLGQPIDPDTMVTVTCGATEGVTASLLAMVDPGDEVILFEPFYENYLPGTHLALGQPVFVRLDSPDFRIDPERLNAAITPRTKAIVLNNPNNPTGRVFDADELNAVAEACRQHDLLLIVDEIYEYITYDGAEFVPAISLPEMWPRTITVSGISKTFSATGWRIGYAVAPPDLTLAIRRVHDFATACAATPLQVAAATAFELPDSYYAELAEGYRWKRDRLLGILRGAGLQANAPQGSYYIFADASAWGLPDSFAAGEHLAKEAGIASVPGAVYYEEGAHIPPLLRFCFCKSPELLDRVAAQMAGFGGPALENVMQGWRAAWLVVLASVSMGGAVTEAGPGLWRYDLLDGKLARLGDGRSIAWSKAAQRVVYLQSTGDRSARLCTMDRDGTGRQVVVEKVTPCCDWAEFSADGQYLAVAGIDFDAGDKQAFPVWPVLLTVYTASGKKVRGPLPIGQWEFEQYAPVNNMLSWSPTGHRLAITPNLEDQRVPYILDAANGRRLKFTGLPGARHEQTWSVEGRTFFIQHLWQPSFSGDGRWLAFSGGAGIVAVPTDGSGNRRLLSKERASFAGVPSGTDFVVSAASGVRRISLAGETVRAWPWDGREMGDLAASSTRVCWFGEALQSGSSPDDSEAWRVGLWLADADGEAKRCVRCTGLGSLDVIADSAPSWSDDGLSIFFEATPDA